MSMSVRSSSPDGRFQVRVWPWELRQSLRIDMPEVFMVATGETLLKFSSNMWSLDRESWHASDRVQLVLRQYPGNHFPKQLIVMVDCAHRTGELESRGVVPLPELETFLESQLSWG